MEEFVHGKDSITRQVYGGVCTRRGMYMEEYVYGEASITRLVYGGVYT